MNNKTGDKNLLKFLLKMFVKVSIFKGCLYYFLKNQENIQLMLVNSNPHIKCLVLAHIGVYLHFKHSSSINTAPPSPPPSCFELRIQNEAISIKLP